MSKLFVDVYKNLIKRLRKHMRKYGLNGYVLKIDFSKYFDSIPHKKLIERFSKYIKDERIIELITYLISTFPGEKGVGLGAQISQIAGIFYLGELDDYCKIVLGIKFYVRYMDDIIIIHYSKETLKKIKELIIEKADFMELSVNLDKTQIIRLSVGFTFLKIQYKGSHKKIDKSIYYREIRKIRNLPLEVLIEQYKGWKGNYKENNLLREEILIKFLEPLSL